MNASELKFKVETATTETLFFSRSNMRFGGDTMSNMVYVLRWGLPIDADMRAFMATRYTADFLNSFPSWGQS